MEALKTVVGARADSVGQHRVLLHAIGGPRGRNKHWTRFIFDNLHCFVGINVLTELFPSLFAWLFVTVPATILNMLLFYFTTKSKCFLFFSPTKNFV